MNIFYDNSPKSESKINAFSQDKWFVGRSKFVLVNKETRNLVKDSENQPSFTDNLKVILGSKPSLRYSVGDTTYELNIKYTELIKEIENSKYLIDFISIDEETGERTLYKKSTWEACIRFIIEFANWANYEYNCFIPKPTIMDGINGNIDVHWEGEKFRVLMNFNAKNIFATYYGDNYGDDFIKGKIDISNFNGLKISSLFGIIINNELPC